MFFKTDIAQENWDSKYRYDNESEIATWERVALNLASVEKEPQKWYDTFLKTIVKFKDGNPVGLKCTPGGRITANIGTKFSGATLLNCFIGGPVTSATVSYERKTTDGKVSYPVQIKTSESPDDLFNIFLTIMEQAKTLASEGGYGLNFDWIRPRGYLIKGTGIRHPGVVAYLKIWDAVAECIVKGDNDGYADKIKNYLKIDDTKVSVLIDIIKKTPRKGAMLCALSVSHPDCEEYIRAKQTSGVLTKFNMSVLLDDKFLIAVENDDFYEQGFNGKITKKIKARDLYDLIMESTYNRGEPGVLFYSNMQKNNPVAYLGDVTATNPCGEVAGLSTLTTVCLLGSVNLTQYVEINNSETYFDWQQYETDVRIFARMLDNVCNLSNAPLPSYSWSIKNVRQYGMGLNGLGSAMMMLGIPYNSKEGIKFAQKAAKIKENLTWQTSALLAEEKGTFPAYIKEQFENTEYFKSDRITDETRELLRRHGARNGKTTTNPPAGHTAIICDNTSNGIEPPYRLEYERKAICKEWPQGLNTENVKELFKYHKKNDFEYWDGEYQGKKYYYEPHNRGLCECVIIRDYGYQWLIDNFPTKNHKKYAISANDLNIDDHLAIQEVIQYYNNQSCSKTINLPNKYPFEDFKSLYLKAWKIGLVGLTTYREGSMESVLSSIDDKRDIIKKDLKLPDVFLNGPTTIIKKEGIKYYIHFSYFPDDTDMKYPVCLWIYTNSEEKGMSIVCNKASRELAKLAVKCGIDNKHIEETLEKCKIDYPHNRLGRFISLCLRHNVPREDILMALQGIEGDNISTLLTAVRKFIGQTIKEGTKLQGKKCPNCNVEGEMIFESGCFRCLACNYAGCS